MALGLFPVSGDAVSGPGSIAPPPVIPNTILIAGVSGQTAAAHVQYAAVGHLSATSPTTAHESTQLAGMAVLAATSMSQAVGGRIEGAAVTIVNRSGEFTTAAANIVASATVVSQNVSAQTADGRVASVQAAATLAAVSTQSATGRVASVQAAATVTATSAQTATGKNAIQAAAILAAVSAQTAAGKNALVSASAELDSQGQQFLFAGKLIDSGAITFSAVSAETAFSNPHVVGSTSMSDTSAQIATAVRTAVDSAAISAMSALATIGGTIRAASAQLMAVSGQIALSYSQVDSGEILIQDFSGGLIRGTYYWEPIDFVDFGVWTPVHHPV